MTNREFIDQLARVVGWRNAQDCRDCKITKSGPFAELINFPAAKLAADFAEFSAEVIADQDPYFCQKYAEWWEACKLAAQNGAIDFH